MHKMKASDQQPQPTHYESEVAVNDLCAQVHFEKQLLDVCGNPLLLCNFPFSAAFRIAQRSTGCFCFRVACKK